MARRHLTADINDSQQFDFFLPNRSPQLSADIQNISVTSGTGLLFGTTTYWNSQPSLIAKENTIYVYTDYRTTEDGRQIAGFKVGDGTTYLIDLPFTDAPSKLKGVVQFGTTAEWDGQATLVAEANTLYVYTDHHTTSGGDPVPAYKVGDGNSYLIDLPFSDVLWEEHINNTVVHITAEERTFWNNKVTAYYTDAERLILTKENI